MRKLLFTTSLLLLSIYTYSQSPTEYTVSQNGITDYIVTETPGNSKEDIYIKTLEWINRSFNNPKEVLKGQILNEYIRIEGTTPNIDCWKNLGMTVCRDVKYHIEISVKDGKYKFDLIEIQSYVPSSRYTRGGWSNLYSQENLKNMWKKDGTIKDRFKDFYLIVPNHLNALNKNLKEYIENKTATKQSNTEW